jgi:hypothetical protein
MEVQPVGNCSGPRELAFVRLPSPGWLVWCDGLDHLPLSDDYSYIYGPGHRWVEVRPLSWSLLLAVDPLREQSPLGDATSIRRTLPDWIQLALSSVLRAKVVRVNNRAFCFHDISSYCCYLLSSDRIEPTIGRKSRRCIRTKGLRYGIRDSDINRARRSDYLDNEALVLTISCQLTFMRFRMMSM